MNEMSYSRFINGLKVAGIEVNRKMLADIAINDAKGFTNLCKLSQKALEKTAK